MQSDLWQNKIRVIENTNHIDIQGVTQELIEINSLLVWPGIIQGAEAGVKFFLMHLHFDIRFLKCPNIVFCLPYSCVYNESKYCIYKREILRYTTLILCLRLYALTQFVQIF